MRRLAKWQAKHGEGQDFTGRRAFDEYPERWQPGAVEGQQEMQQQQGSNEITNAAILEERMKREMWERNHGMEQRSSMASSQQPMIR